MQFLHWQRRRARRREERKMFVSGCLRLRWLRALEGGKSS